MKKDILEPELMKRAMFSERAAGHALSCDLPQKSETRCFMSTRSFQQAWRTTRTGWLFWLTFSGCSSGLIMARAWRLSRNGSAQTVSGVKAFFAIGKASPRFYPPTVIGDPGKKCCPSGAAVTSLRNERHFFYIFLVAAKGLH